MGEHAQSNLPVVEWAPLELQCSRTLDVEVILEDPMRAEGSLQILDKPQRGPAIQGPTTSPAPARLLTYRRRRKLDDGTGETRPDLPLTPTRLDFDASVVAPIQESTPPTSGAYTTPKRHSPQRPSMTAQATTPAATTSLNSDQHV